MNDEHLRELFEEHRKTEKSPSPPKVALFFNNLLGFLFPEFSARNFTEVGDFEAYYRELEKELSELISERRDYNPDSDATVTPDFFQSLPEIKALLRVDVLAMYEGDPAAKSYTEVIRAYPGFYAIAAYRIAHSLHDLGMGLIARIITENAHSRTGIDIHPAAEIGRSFCIDHGTGVVIGETTVIGDHVKVYQGVTLGALSVRKEDAAVKRHPTIEDHVVIYAGASILGGETVVGHHSVIGGNVWLTRSVPARSKVYYEAKFINEVNEKGKKSKFVF